MSIKSVKTPIQQLGDFWIKRDDLFVVADVPGGKVRTCFALATAAKKNGAHTLITAGSRASPQVNIVAHIARHLGMKSRCHTPQGALSPEVLAAKEAGAEIIQHRAGYNSVIVARAREDAKTQGCVEIPFGMECEEAITQTRRQVSIPDGVKRIVVPVGSGMSLAGILHGLIDINRTDIPVLGIVVGADPTTRLYKYAPNGLLHGCDWQHMVTLLQAGIDYHKEPKETCFMGIQLDPNYESKCIKFLIPNDLLWIVGIRQTASLLYK